MRIVDMIVAGALSVTLAVPALTAQTPRPPAKAGLQQLS